jgi:hypothetical protein
MGSSSPFRHLPLPAVTVSIALWISPAHTQTDCSKFVGVAGINPAGTIAGSFDIDRPPGSMGFIRVGESITPFAVGPTGRTTVADINASGSIIGAHLLGLFDHGFLRSADGSIVTFDVPGADATTPVAMNNHGWISGYWEVLDPPQEQSFIRYPDGSITTFAVPGADFTIATDINSEGVVTGRAGAQADQRIGGGFVRAVDGTLTIFRPGQATYPSGINPDGLVVGTYIDRFGAEQGFLRSPDGTIVSFTIPGAESFGPTAINPAGVVTGAFTNGTGQHAFIRQPDGTITTFDVPGALATVATTISPSGTVAGSATAADGCGLGFVRSRSGVITTFEIPVGTGSLDQIDPVASRNQLQPSARNGAVDLAKPVRSGDSWRIEYSLPADADVAVALYDLAGRQVAVVDRGPRTAGTHQTSWRQPGVANGVYFLRLQAGASRTSRTIVIRN